MYIHSIRFLTAVFTGMFMLLIPTAYAANVTLISDPDSKRITFAVGDIKKALEFRGHTVTTLLLAQLNGAQGDVFIILAAADNADVRARLQTEGGALPGDLRAQGFAIRTTRSSKTSFWVLGGDDIGVMYGGLELAKKLHVYDVTGSWNFKQNAYIKNRGIKFNIALDKRNRTYSQWDTQHINAMIKAVWDMKFWENYFDEMARARLNLISFWCYHPFTVMMKVPGYENIALADVYDYKGKIKTMSIEEKNTFWKAVHARAHERGIKVYWMTWNIFMDGALNKCGITESYKNPATIAYLRKTMTQFLTDFPTINGYIIHAGEHFDTDDRNLRTKFCLETYGLGVNDYQKQHDPDKRRDFNFIYRLHEGSISTITSYFDKFAYNYDFSIKYSWAHMYSYPAPTYYKDTGGENVIDMLKKTNKRVWLNVRNDDFYYLNWGNYEYARTYILNIPQESGDKNKDRYVPGFYIGSDGNTGTMAWYCKDNALSTKLDIQKNWYAWYAFGYVGYDPYRTVEDFKDVMRMKYANVSADELYRTWSAASRGMPMSTTLVSGYTSWSKDFRWWPGTNWARNTWGSIAEWASKGPMEGSEIPIAIPSGSDWAPKGVCGFADYKSNKCGSRENPVDWGLRVKNYAMQCLGAPQSSSDKELQLVLDDIRALSYQSWFYSSHIRATAHHLKGDKTKAIEAAAEAYNAWQYYSEIMEKNYKYRRHIRVFDNNEWAFKLKHVLDDYHYVGGTGTPKKITPTVGINSTPENK